MAIPQTLELTDGTTTIDLLSGVIRLEQDGWEPQIAPDRVSELGGQSPYEDVEEPLRLQAVYAAGVNVGAAYAAIQRLLAQGRRWALGDSSAAPVRLRAAADGGAIVLESIVIGGHLPSLPASFHRLYQAGALPAVDATIRRRGWWLDPDGEDAQSSAVTLQELMTVTWPTDHPHDCPITLALAQESGSDGTGYLSGGIVLATSAAAFQIIDAEDMRSSVGGSPLGDESARGGAVFPVTGGALDYGPVTPFRTADIYMVGSTQPGKQFVVTATVYNSGIGITGVIRSGISVSAAVRGEDDVYWVPDAGYVPMLVYIGTLSIPENTTIDAIRIGIVQTDGSGTGVLIIDTVLIVSRDYGPVYAMLAPITSGSNPYDIYRVGTAAGANRFTAIAIDHAPLARASARVCQTPSTDPLGPAAAYLRAQGDPAIWMPGQMLVGWASLSSASDTTPLYRSNGMVGSHTATYRLIARCHRAYLSLE